MSRCDACGTDGAKGRLQLRYIGEKHLDERDLCICSKCAEQLHACGAAAVGTSWRVTDVAWELIKGEATAAEG